MKYQFFTVLCVFLFSYLSAQGQTNPQDTTQNLTDTEKLYGLSLFWKEASYNFAFFDQVPNLDWDKAYQEYIPKVLAAKSTFEYYRVLQQFCALLKDGHTRIHMPELAMEQLAWPAIAVKEVQHRAIVFKTNKSLASTIPIGSEILKLNDISTEKYLKEYVFPYIFSSTEHILWAQAIATGLLTGTPDSSVRLTIRLPGGEIKEQDVVRSENMDWLNSAFNKKKKLLEFEWLEKEIAYVALNSFEDKKIIAEFGALLPELYKARGVIIDIRNNSGGSTAIGTAIAQHFTTETLVGSSWRTRKHIAAFKAWGKLAGQYKSLKKHESYYKGTAWHKGSPDIVTPSQGQKISVPIVILISRGTASAAEDFLIYLDPVKHVTYIGEPTFGSTGQPLSFDLPGGGSARVCTKRDTYPDGREFVGYGIAPNVIVHPTIEDFISDHDRILKRGIEVLKQKLK